jgi:hypothetical protein
MCHFDCVISTVSFRQSAMSLCPGCSLPPNTTHTQPQCQTFPEDFSETSRTSFPSPHNPSPVSAPCRSKSGSNFLRFPNSTNRSTRGTILIDSVLRAYPSAVPSALTGSCNGTRPSRTQLPSTGPLPSWSHLTVTQLSTAQSSFLID